MCLTHFLSASFLVLAASFPLKPFQHNFHSPQYRLTMAVNLSRCQNRLHLLTTFTIGPSESVFPFPELQQERLNDEISSTLDLTANFTDLLYWKKSTWDSQRYWKKATLKYWQRWWLKRPHSQEKGSLAGLESNYPAVLWLVKNGNGLILKMNIKN